MIFPLSMSHLNETNHIADYERRKKLSSLMVKISKCYTLQPYFNRLLKAEIRNYVLLNLHLNTINIRDHILKKGISNLLGAKPELVPREGVKNPKPIPEDLRNKLLDLLESPEAMSLAFMQRSPESIEDNKKKLVNRLEKIRHELSAIKDSNLRKRVFFARNIIEVVVPELVKISVDLNLPKYVFFKEKPTRKDIEILLDNVPTARVLLTLLYHRDNQLKRAIKANDFNDIWFLTLAIPYSDIVVT